MYLTPSWHHLHVRRHVSQLRPERNAVGPIVFDHVVFLILQVIRVLQRIKGRHIDVFILKMVAQVLDGLIRVLARAIQCRRRLLLADHFYDTVHELQNGAMPAREKISAVNVEP